MAKAKNVLDRDILIPYPGLQKPIRLAPGDVVTGAESYIRQINAGHHGVPKPLEIIESDPPISQPVISREAWEQQVADQAVIRASVREKTGRGRGRPPKSDESFPGEIMTNGAQQP